MEISRRGFVSTALAAPLLSAVAEEAGAPVPMLRNDRDLSLPAWGPYSKKYAGISHVANAQAGLRFDIGFFPGFFRRTALISNVGHESGQHPWEASADLNYYCTRFQLEWKDQVFTDLSFTALDPETRLICCDLQNRTSSPQNLALHFIAGLYYPDGCETVDLPEGAIWVDGVHYHELSYAKPRPTDNLVPDGLLRGEVRDSGFVGGRGIGRRFGADAGDRVEWRFELPAALGDAGLLVRFRGSARLVVSLDWVDKPPIEVSSLRAFSTITIPAGPLGAGRHTLRFVGAGGGDVELDGFAVCPRDALTGIRFRAVPRNYQPQILGGPYSSSRLLKYPDVAHHYGFAWNFDQFEVREFLCGDLDEVFRYRTHDHVSTVIRGPGEGHHTDIFLRPITLAPKSSQRVWGLVTAGSRDDVTRTLAAFRGRQDLDQARETARARRVVPPTTAEGSHYGFSQERMAATTLTNVVYPLRLRDRYIRHNTPGRWWDSFYTWDSGFIGLGLLEHSLQRAVDCLNTYMSDPGDPHAAFLHHGSPVPVQIYLFHEIWNRTQSRPLLEYFYPRLRQMHLFLAGRLGSSTTRNLKSQLIRTWDYFYNSGGWDDYPPQRHVHAEGLEAIVATASNTSHAIRTAKILRMAALELGRHDDIAQYEADIRTWTGALQRYAWDEQSGYFGYVVHSRDGNPTGVLRHSNGQNFNMGLDGAYPLVAGVCSRAQAERLCGHLMNDREMWTPIGLTAVSQSAAYYRNDGYWNGAVWMPHQWFLWKTMWDLGRPKDADRIARTGLDLWKNEVERSYNCFEHFLVQSGRGAGWHQFGGLSTPVMSWFGAYHRPGRLTTGFDAWVRSLKFEAGESSLRADLSLHSPADTTPTVMAGMAPGRSYRVRWANKPAVSKEIAPGVLQIELNPEGGLSQRLEIDG